MTQFLPRLLTLLALLSAGCAADPAPAPRLEPTSGVASTAARLLVDGDAGTRELSVDDLRALGAVDVPWTHKDSTHSYSAVPFEAILRSLGLQPGAMDPAARPSEKRAIWKYAVIATAADGFQAAFSVAEVFRGMGPTEAFVAIAEGGQPLDAASGPLRIVVPTDGEGSRSVRNLQRLTIIDLRRSVPAR